MKLTLKLAVIHYLAKALGVLVHVEGMPLGSSRNVPRNPYSGSEQGGIGSLS